MANWLFVSLLALMGGCATQGKNTFDYKAPESNKIVNEVTVSAPYSRVWDVLVRDLAKSFYVINNIDKESRIINVSFTSTEAADFVDCGRTARVYTEGPSIETFEYAVAARSTFKIASAAQEHPAMTNYAVVVREPTLEGRANIYIAPLESDSSKTTVSVNTRYVLSLKVKGEAFAKHISGIIHPRGRIPEDTSLITFNTNTSGRLEQGQYPAVVCLSKGKLEADILAITKGI